ncbi:MAG: hypothetical protein JW804_04535 [Sedimentisphaerales bacterium]|nr:hypothetical protein [Sedimentisphaerales bacterium]
MKDSKTYSKNVQKFFRSARRKYGKVAKVRYDDVTESIIHGVLLEYLSESVVRSAFRRFDDYFVDLNDLRVSRPEEVIEMLGEDTPQSRTAATNLIKILRAIFRKYNNLDQSSLQKAGKRQAKVNLEKFEGMSSFCADYCMLTALGGHAIPLTEQMVSYLRENEMVHPEADNGEIEGFLTRQISAANGYEFYSLLRRESESARKKASKAKITDKKTTEKKTSKKTQKKKK